MFQWCLCDSFEDLLVIFDQLSYISFICVDRTNVQKDVSLAILKGAVLYGINPRAITIRRSRLTYGVAVLNRFIQGRHPEEKRVVKDSIHYCKDILDKFVSADQSVCFGERVVRSYSPASRSQSRIVLNIFCSETDDVQVSFDY